MAAVPFSAPNRDPAAPRSHLSPSSSSFCSPLRSDPWRTRLHLGLAPLRSSRPPFVAGLPRPVSVAAGLPRSEHDVIIVGAGIIGLTIARQLLLSSDLSVAVVDAAMPCSGATGAGQGYIWMAHKTPSSETWELARRSKQLWEELAENIVDKGMDPTQVLGWKKSGSLLVGRNSMELGMLEERVRLLNEAGVRAEFLSASSLKSVEPALNVGKQGGAAFLPDDCQLDAFQTVAFIEEENKYFTSEGRYQEFYGNPAVQLISSGNAQTVEAVQTSKNVLHAKRAVVIAAGAWSGALMQSLSHDPISLPAIPVKPRKGYLLVLEDFKKIQLNHGLMEVGYIHHQTATSSDTSSASEVEHDQIMSSISMTATFDVNGNLLLGSSRQFLGYDREIDKAIIKRIWDHAGEFFPVLKDLSLDINTGSKIKLGHRPYMPDGKPVIGLVPSSSNIFLATGHEGGGLCMALGTAEMVADMIHGNRGKVNCTPYSVQGRFY